MSLIVLGLAGVAVGVVGSELLRATNPKFVEKIEASAKRFAARIAPSDKSGEDDEPDKPAHE